MNLPDKKNQAYDFVNLNRLKGLPHNGAVAKPLEKRSGIVFSNGFFLKEASNTPQEVVVLPIHEALNSYGGVLNKRLEIQETDYFAHLNKKNTKDGVFIYVPPKLQVKLDITHFISETALITPRLHLFLGAEAEAKLTFSYHLEEKITPLLSEVIDLNLSERSGLKISLDTRGFPSEATHFASIRATLKRASRFESVSVTHGSNLSRFDYAVELQQEGANASLKGLTHLFDSNEAHSNVLMSHKAPHCTSSQLFKTLLEDTSSSSFQGKIYVDQKAQKTEAFQLNKNLLLDKRSRAYCKPNLEIFADDVKASHGATFGHLNEEQLFYLKARGLSEKSAKEILIKGFIEELLMEL